MSLSFDCEFGALGIDNDRRHPLARAVKKLLKTGSPIQRLGKVFISGREPGAEPQVGDLHRFGVFVVTDGGRLVFFPGTESPLVAGDVARGPVVEFTDQMPLDHLTLKSDRRTWHITSAGSAEHRSRTDTLDIGEGRVLWFSLQCRDHSLFRPVLRKTTVVATVPKSDSARRARVFELARDELEFPIVSALRHPSVALAGGILHLAIVVGPPGFPHYDGGQLGWQLDSPFHVEGVPGDMRGQPVWIVRAFSPAVRGHRNPRVLAPWPAASPGRALRPERAVSGGRRASDSQRGAVASRTLVVALVPGTTSRR